MPDLTPLVEAMEIDAGDGGPWVFSGYTFGGVTSWALGNEHDSIVWRSAGGALPACRVPQLAGVEDPALAIAVILKAWALQLETVPGVWDYREAALASIEAWLACRSGSEVVRKLSDESLRDAVRALLARRAP